MKRNYLLVVAVVLVAVIAFWFFFSGQQEALPAPEPPLVVHELSDPLNKSYAVLLAAYFDIKNGLVENDTALVHSGANRLQMAADSIPVDQITGDSTGAIQKLARNYVSSLKNNVAALIGESTLSLKRKDFEVMSDLIWNLTRVVRYKGSKVYYQHCPMAFQNKGAYWVSESASIRNPYFGHQMLECGTLEDSLDFTRP